MEENKNSTEQRDTGEPIETEEQKENKTFATEPWYRKDVSIYIFIAGTGLAAFIGLMEGNLLQAITFGVLFIGAILMLIGLKSGKKK